MSDASSFSWLLEPAFMDDPELYKVVLLDTAEIFAKQFDAISSTKDVLLDSVSACSAAGYRLSFGTDNSENTISPDTCIGGGEICHYHGKYAVLFFATLRKRFEQYLSIESAECLSFCTERGEEITLSNLTELEAELVRLGSLPDDLLADAEAVGFVEKVFHLREIPSNEPSTFF